MTERVIKYAQRAYLRDIDDWLGNPDDLVINGRIPERIIESYRLLARDMGLDFDQLIRERGTPYERERFRRLIAGEPIEHQA